MMTMTTIMIMATAETSTIAGTTMMMILIIWQN
jgi:hypothetical protein